MWRGDGMYGKGCRAVTMRTEMELSEDSIIGLRVCFFKRLFQNHQVERRAGVDQLPLDEQINDSLQTDHFDRSGGSKADGLSD